ncbi:MAG: hypothetical protein ABFD08_19760, partial [Syntrophomonas sp.]
LPNHVTGKGMIKELRRQYPQANIVAIDYDPGASEVNQLNRLKLMLSVAMKNFSGKDGQIPSSTPFAGIHIKNLPAAGENLLDAQSGSR